MHELGIMTSVCDTAQRCARDAGALRILEVRLSVGEMTEAIPDALHFAFEVLRDQPEYPLLDGAELVVDMIAPKSLCLECGAEFTHDRFHMLCPECGGFATKLLAGRELEIAAIDVDLPDEELGEGSSGEAAEGLGAGKTLAGE